MTNKTSHNPIKHKVLAAVSQRLADGWGISQETSGIANTALIHEIAVMIKKDDGEFKEFCVAMYQICKTWPDKRKKDEIFKDFA